MARRAKPELALPTVWQCTAERQWLWPLAGWSHGEGKKKPAKSGRMQQVEVNLQNPGNMLREQHNCLLQTSHITMYSSLHQQG